MAPKKSYSSKFREKTVRLVLSSGRAAREGARDLGIPGLDGHRVTPPGQGPGER